MKREKLKAFGVFIVSLITAFIACAALTACDNFKGPSWSGDCPDSTYVAELHEATVNPSFTSTNDVLMFQNKLIEELTVEDIFTTLPEEVLTNVTTVCLRKYVAVTMKDIVTEYRINRAVYDNLPSKNSQPQSQAPTIQQSTTPPLQANPPAMEERHKPVDTTKVL